MERKQQLLCIYSLGEQLHKNISDCYRVTSSEDNWWEQLTSSAGLIKVQKKKTTKEPVNIILLHLLQGMEVINLQSQADMEVGTGEGRYAC